MGSTRMPVTFTCGCGEELTVEESQVGLKAFCPKCRKSVDIPDSSKSAGSSTSGKDGKKDASKGDLPEDAPTPAEELEKVTDLQDESQGKEEEGSTYDGEIFEPPRIERIKAKDGSELFKMTCFCEKRILSPLRTGFPVGRCPKCGRRLRLPGYRPESRKQGSATSKRSKTEVLKEEDIPKKEGTPPVEGSSDNMSLDEKIEFATKVFRASERRKLTAMQATPVSETDEATGEKKEETKEEPKQEASEDPRTEAQKEDDKETEPAIKLTADGSEDDVGTIVMDPQTPEHIKEQLKKDAANRDAAIRTADRLRAHHRSQSSSRGEVGLISAWPLAGKGPRALAGFVDITFCTVATGVLLVLAAIDILPHTCFHPVVIITAFVTAGLLNDGLLQHFGGGFGKRMVVLVLRRRNGQGLGVVRVFLRGLLKWLLLPGWLMGFFDPAERTLHDLICGTLVLKGRSRV